jgi:hypothetical protein
MEAAKMATVSLCITFEPENGDRVTLARVQKRALLLDAAGEAILEAERLAAQMADEDTLLGELHRDEAGRLRRALELVLPELRTTAGAIQ